MRARGTLKVSVGALAGVLALLCSTSRAAPLARRIRPFVPYNWKAALLTSPFDETHQSITDGALRELDNEFFHKTKLTEPMENAIAQIAEANGAVDEDQHTAAKHFDGESFVDGQARLVSLFRGIQTSLKAGDANGARTSLGSALHSIQDFYAHSNWVELGHTAPSPDLGRPGRSFPVIPETTATCNDCLVETCVSCANNLIYNALTSGYYGGEDRVKKVPGKCSHGGATDFSTSGYFTGGGINKDASVWAASPHCDQHAAAVAVAKEATKQFLRDIQAAVTPRQLRLLLGVGSTLAIAIDTTGSMGPIIDGVKQQSIQIINDRLGTDEEPADYVLAPFNDPGVGPLTLTDDPDVFKAAISGLGAGGGNDCPELSMTGALQAVAASDEGGTLFLFTDADAKDSGVAGKVSALAVQKEITIYAFVFGKCPTSTRAPEGHADRGDGQSAVAEALLAGGPVDPTYGLIASASGGQVFSLSPSEAGKVTKLADFVVRTSLVNLLLANDSASGTHTYSVPVDSTLTRVTFSVSGSATATIKRPNGSTVQASDSGVSLVSVSGGAITSITTLASGTWSVSLAATGSFSLTVTGESPLDLSSFTFVRVGGRPGHEGYYAIAGFPPAGEASTAHAVLRGSPATVQFELRSKTGATLQHFTLPKGSGVSSNEYLGSLTPPSAPFLVYATGQDSSGLAYQRALPGTIQPQSVTITAPPAQDLSPPAATTYAFSVKNLGASNTFKFTGSDDKGYLTGITPATIALASGQTIDVTAVLRPPADAVPGSYDTLTVTAESTSGSGVSNFAIVKSAVVSGSVDVSPASIDFGNVSVGQSKDATLTLKNLGNSAITVSSLLSSSSQFRVVSPATPFTLDSGAQQSVTARFTPAASGSQSGTLTVVSSAAGGGTRSVALAGSGTGGGTPGTEEEATDDGTVETGALQDGLIVVNRFTPSRYPATLKTIRIFFVQFQSLPSPAGAKIRFVLFLDPTGSGTPPASPSLLTSDLVTIPSVSASGSFIDFDLNGVPALPSGDIYLGFQAPSPAGGVVFSADSNGTQRQRGYFSTDGGSSFQGPLVLGSGSSQTRVNIMIRGVMSVGGGGGCAYSLSPASQAVVAAATSGTVAVTAGSGCAWTAASSSPFVTITSGASGSGNGTVAFQVAANGGVSSRTGTLTVAGLTFALSQSASATGASSSVLVPIVLSLNGLNGAFFTSEMMLTNRGTTTAAVDYVYTAAFGGGSGTASDLLPAGRQRFVPDVIAYLRSIGVPLAASGDRGGTLLVRFSNLSAASAGSATVRTTSPVPDGRAGFSYAGVPPPAALTGAVYLCGLRQNAADRSNVAIQNAGSASSGNVTLRVTIFSGDPASPVVKTLPDETLPPGGFKQFSGILGLAGSAVSNGFVKVERVAGTAPYYAYAVVNDQANSDGSFVPPVPEGALTGRPGLTVPVIVETATFTSELVLTNWSGVKKTVRFAFVADAVTAPGNTASFSLEVAPRQQLVIPNVVKYLRDRGTAGIGAPSATFVGALFATVDGGDAAGIFAGARTSAAGGGGRYGFFCVGVPYGGAATTSAWLFGLQQNAENRTNLALVNTGEVDGGSDTFRIEIFDGDSGFLIRVVDGVQVGARKFLQISAFLSQYVPGTTNAYVRVTRTSGTNPFITYAVVNDGGQPGQRSGDGSFVSLDGKDDPS